MSDDAEWELVRCLFRTESDDDPIDGFDRAAQLRLTAGTLTHLRQTRIDLWNSICETRGIGSLNERDHRGVREFKKLLEHLVRTADESTDHRRTVAFVSRGVVREILQRSGGKPTLKQVKSGAFSHEHGVPVDALIRTIVYPKNVGVDLYDVLEAMSCRALLLKEQSGDVDKGFKSSLAGWIRMPWGSYPMGSLPLRLLALARYDAASPTLLDELIPTSRRAEKLLAEFKGFVRGTSKDSITGVKRMTLDHKAARLAYLPDYAFDWARAKPVRHGIQSSGTAR
jgi:hypothetical protein